MADRSSDIGILSRPTTGVKPMISGIAPATWFGPLQPLAPIAPETKGRAWDYQPGYNIQVVPRAYEPVGFREMRALADAYDVLRLVIETRKDQASKMKWRIRLKDQEWAEPGGKKKALDAARPRIDALTARFRYPDNEHDWAEWLRMLLEDMLVIDAVSIYPRRTLGGGIYSYELIDGATIMPKIDADGRTPAPPSIAYQQVLHGVPTSDFSRDELAYRPRNRRTSHLYGLSPVQQIIMTVNIALRRQIYQLSYYTEGNVPEALIPVPETWTADQIREYQGWWDELMEGNLAQRRHAKFVPGGMEKVHETKAGVLTDAADEWFTRVVCFAFSISPQAFIKQMNRSTSETAKQAAQEEGLEPLLLWVKTSVMDYLIQKYEGQPDLEFAWEEEDDTAPLNQAVILDKKVRNGTMTPDEARAKDGLDPLPNGIGAKPLIYTPQGAVLLEQVVNPPPAPEPPAALAVESGKGKVESGEGGTTDGQPQKAQTDEPDKQAEKGKKAGKAGEAGEKGAGTGVAKVNASDFPLSTFHFPLAKAAMPPKLSPIDRERKAVKSARADLQKLVEKAFKKVKASVKKLDLEKLDSSSPFSPLPSPIDALAKATDDKLEKRVEAVLAQLDLDGFAVIQDDVEDILKRVTADGTVQALLQIGLSEEDLTDVMRTKAEEYAGTRAAELVGKGANPEYAITDSTRAMLRNDVKSAIEDGWSTSKFADAIEENYAFSPGRAETIARTEIAFADVQGNMTAYRESGVVDGKQWIGGSETDCEECDANVAAGVIDLDEDFPSGDDAPPAHPNCVCDVLPVLAEKESE